MDERGEGKKSKSRFKLELVSTEYTILYSFYELVYRDAELVGNKGKYNKKVEGKRGESGVWRNGLDASELKFTL